MKNLVVRFVREENGQDMIEYAILAGIIALTVIGSVSTISGWVDGKFSALAGGLK